MSADQEQAPEDGEEDQPEIDDEERADVDFDVLADEVEDEAGADADDQQDDQADEEPWVGPKNESADAPHDVSGGESWGDMYVGTLTTVSNALIEEFGEDEDRIEEALARDLHLDEYFDEWMQTKGKADMPPEQALLVGTLVFMVTVVGTKTELPQKLLEEAELS